MFSLTYKFTEQHDCKWLHLHTYDVLLYNVVQSSIIGNEEMATLIAAGSETGRARCRARPAHPLQVSIARDDREGAGTSLHY